MNSDPEFRCDTSEIVHEKPPSGVFAEVLFGSVRGNTLWVKFSDRHGLGEWGSDVIVPIPIRSRLGTRRPSRRGRGN